MNRKLSLESLESRNLCAVVTKLSSSGTLSITGDSNSNLVYVTGNGFGSMSVTGDGVTQSFSNVKNLKIDLKGESDGLTLSGLRIEGNLSVKTGTGVDEVAVIGSVGVVRGNSTFDLGKEDLDDLYIGTNHNFGGSTAISASDVTIKGTFSAGGNSFGNLSIKGPSGSSLTNRIALDGGGGSHFEEPGDIHIKGNLTITSSAKTKLLLDDVYVRIDPATNNGGNVTIKLSGYDDRMYIDDCYFTGTVKASFGGGDDTIKIYDTIYAGKLNADGGSGANKVYDHFTVVYPDDAKTKNLTIVSDETISFGSDFPFN